MGSQIMTKDHLAVQELPFHQEISQSFQPPPPSLFSPPCTISLLSPLPQNYTRASPPPPTKSHRKVNIRLTARLTARSVTRPMARHSSPRLCRSSGANSSSTPPQTSMYISHCKDLLTAHHAPAAAVIKPARYMAGFTPAARRKRAPEMAPAANEFMSSCLPLQLSMMASTRL